MNTKPEDIRLTQSFFTRDVLKVAPDLLGCYLVRNNHSGTDRYLITEVEAYRGEEDKACHAKIGKTPRTKVMYENGGILYVYLIYGIHWMLNVVTAEKDNPQAILIRGTKEVSGPGRLTKKLEIDGSFNGVNIARSELIWIEQSELKDKKVVTGPRVGVDYAGDYYSKIPWRYILRF